jgi:imidazolonepropionase-like amidohydrolase
LEVPIMPLAIRAGSLIDGTGQLPRRNVLILIDKNRFESVAPASEAAVPPGYEVIDASRYTVLPGLIDQKLLGRRMPLALALG